MGIKLSTSQSALDNFFQSAMAIIKQEILTAYAKLGEECNARIRDRSAEESWIDHTGNLRSSIGYAIFDYGRKQVESAFASIGNGSNGSQEGRQMIADLAKEYSQVYALVVVAAMNYADFVEAKYEHTGYVSTLGLEQAKVHWVEPGTQFFIDEYDGSEILTLIKDNENLLTA